MLIYFISVSSEMRQRSRMGEHTLKTGCTGLRIMPTYGTEELIEVGIIGCNRLQFSSTTIELDLVDACLHVQPPVPIPQYTFAQFVRNRNWPGCQRRTKLYKIEISAS